MPTSKAVLLIGGPSKGTRFRPLSLDVPKPLFSVGGRPIIWHSLVALSHVEGLNEVLLVGFYDESVINPFVKEAARDFPNLNIRYLREFQSLGTAGGLYHYRDILSKGNPDQIFVLHSDIVCGWPLAELQKFHGTHRGVGTVMAVKVPREEVTKFGCIVIDPQTSQARHYVEKPEEPLSDSVNAGLYLFDAALLFSSIRDAMEAKVARSAEDPESSSDEQLRLEQDVLSPLASTGKLYAYQTTSPWVQIKSAASAIPANALILASYKTTNPSLLRRRSPTILAKSRADYSKKKGPEIVEPCFIHEDAQIDDTAKIGPNVSIGSGVKIGYGCRVKESIILDDTTLDKNSCVLYSIIGENCKIAPWARVEGAPLVGDKQSIAILGKDVSVLKEVHIRSCIVLPSKNLSRSAKNEVLL
ncbi:mannose-1-phosphate guanylyltransferase [Rhodotorula paludigena]|uniref:mannose-1-phosphate guanylyltransferase n=1 Tax=Rhodotorula paludigena TaxID=86838 RepID=UPI00316B9B37